MSDRHYQKQSRDAAKAARRVRKLQRRAAKGDAKAAAALRVKHPGG